MNTLASWVRTTMTNFSKAIGFGVSDLIRKTLFYYSFIFFAIISRNQAGISKDVIANNILIIIGTFFSAIVISLGLGFKELVIVLLYSLLYREHLKAGIYPNR